MKITLNADKLGIWVSFLCILHCMAIPIVLLVGVAIPISFLEIPWLSYLLIISAFIFGNIAFIKGFKRHNHTTPALVFLFGFCLLCTGELFEVPYHVWYSVLGAVLIMIAHFVNHRYYTSCQVR